MDAVDVEAPVIAVRFTLSLGEYVRGFLFHFGRVVRWFSGLVGGFGVLAVLAALSADASSPPHSVVPGLVFIAIGSAFPLLIAFIAVMESPGRYGRLDTWSWFPDRIHCVTATSSGTMPWAAFK